MTPVKSVQDNIKESYFLAKAAHEDAADEVLVRNQGLASAKDKFSKASEVLSSYTFAAKLLGIELEPGEEKG